VLFGIDLRGGTEYTHSKAFCYDQATLNSAYRPEMPNRAENRGTVGAEFSAHTFQSFHSLSFHLHTVWLFLTTLVVVIPPKKRETPFQAHHVD
jgi:hypothetical protein